MIKNLIKKNYLKIQSLLSSGELSEIGKIYKTDKVDEWHSFGGKNYMDIYSVYLSQFKNETITLLEIGIKGGASLRTFRDYFKKGTILGLDINPNAAFKEDRITTYIGSQSSADVIDKIFSEHPEINIVLDDGSHVNELTIASFNLLFDRLPKGSLYIIEDLYCSYLEEALASDIERGRWPGMHLNDPSIKMINRRADMDNFFLNIIKELDHKRGDVEFVHFWSQTCVIKKID